MDVSVRRCKNGWIVQKREGSGLLNEYVYTELSEMLLAVYQATCSGWSVGDSVIVVSGSDFKCGE